MHLSHVLTSARRRSGICVALISSLLLLGMFGSEAQAAVTGYCSGGTTEWVGGSNGNWGAGDWSTGEGGWSNGYPSNACDTVINGNVTVTFTTISDHYGNEDSASSKGLTLSGGATLVVRGEGDGVQGNWYNATSVNVGADGLTIGQGSTLDLQASSDTATPAGGSAGGTANVTVDAAVSGGSGNANVTNSGAIVASTNDPAWGESFNVGGTIANNGSFTAQSGLLTLQGQNVPYIVDNNGTFAIDSGASAKMLAGDGSAFTNTGSVANQGTFTLQQSMHWNQNAGSTSGNPVELTGGETLADSAGTGAFEVVDGCGTGGTVTGTIPQGQTITVQGATQNCSGNTGQTSQMALGAAANQTVVNHGTIVLNASGSGTTTGGSAQILGGTLDNFGTLDATITDANYTTAVLSPLINEKGATVNLTGGKLYQTAGTATVNEGTVNIGPGGFWQVQGGSFTNSGTLAVKIASKTSYGVFNLTAGGAFKAGGTLAPSLGGYRPAAGIAFALFTLNGGPFTGTFKAVSNGFRGDYSKEAQTPATVDVIYGAAKQSSVRRISGGAGRITLKLSCAKGKACARLSITATVGRTRVASRSAIVKAGKSATATVKLNAAGKKLIKKRTKVKVVVKAAGKTLKTATVTVTK